MLVKGVSINLGYNYILANEILQVDVCIGRRVNGVPLYSFSQVNTLSCGLHEISLTQFGNGWASSGTTVYRLGGRNVSAPSAKNLLPLLKPLPP